MISSSRRDRGKGPGPPPARESTVFRDVLKIGNGVCGFLLGVVLLAGCSDQGGNPLSAREEQLVGQWRLDVPEEVEAEDLEFTYEFARDRRVTNRVGGAFLKVLRERPELEGVDFGRLEQVDGGVVEWQGRWSMRGDTLEVVFERVEVVLFGTVPVLGRLSVPVYFADLPPDQDYEVTYLCAIAGQTLTLEGQALTVGVPIDPAGEVEPVVAGLDPAGAAAVRVMGDFLLQVVRQKGLTQATFSRVR